MHEIAPLIYDLAIMLSLAGIVVLLFQRIHQPVVLGYLVAGMIIGPHTPPHALVNDIPNIRILSELGVIFLMFALGLEFSFKKLTRVGFSASVTGLIEVVLMVLIGYLTGYLLGWSHFDCLFLGAALAISSTTIIIKAIDELGLKTKRFAEIIFGVLIVEDLLAILLLVALSTVVVSQNVFSFNMVSAGVKLILVVGGWFIMGYFIMPPLFRKIAKVVSQETLTIIAVALCLSLATAAASFNYSTALGAFIMGSILAETTLIRRIEMLIKPIRDIFAAVFFITVGMLIDPRIIIENFPLVLLLSLVTIFGKILTTSIAALLTGQSLNTSVRVGFGMAQVGEFSFIIAALGASLHVTSNKLYPLIVAISGITTFTTPYLIRFSGYIGDNLENHLPKGIQYFLENYSAWVYRSQATSQKNPFYRKVTSRVIINAIIVAIIFTLVDSYFTPIMVSYVGESSFADVLCLLTAITLASPFIWGMLFATKKANMPIYSAEVYSPATFAIWLITLAEIVLLDVVYFNTWITIILFVIIATAYFVFSFKHLERSYQWFEKQLITNIKTEEAEKAKYADLAPWDTHLVEIDVGENSPFVGKTLSELKLLQYFNINIVAMSHGNKLVPTPRGDERILAHDRLLVLGTDRQIDAFKRQVEIVAKVTDDETDAFLNNFTLRAFLLDNDHPLVGKTIRDSKIREYINGLVVGLERDNIRILNPDLDVVLAADDLLLVVGEADKIKRFSKRSR